MTDYRPLVANQARWCVANKSFFDYYEARPFPLYRPNAQEHITDDCSATSVLCCWLAGAPEPFAGAYAGWGNTVSFLALEHVKDPLPGDFVVYGEGLPENVQHMAVVLESGPDPLTMSHGQPSEPAFVHAIEGCPGPAQGRITYVRYLPVIAPPQVLEDTMIWSPNAGGTGDFLVHGDKKAGIPSPTALAAVQAQGILEKTLSPAELAALNTVPWGSL